MGKSYSVIDSDGHVLESLEGMRKYLDARWQRPRRPSFVNGSAL